MKHQRTNQGGTRMHNALHAGTDPRFKRLALVVTAVLALFALAMADRAQAATAPDSSEFAVTAGALALSIAPDAPALPALTLNGSAQTLNGQMNNWEVTDATGTGGGWNISVAGDSTTGKSAVFKEYCTDGVATNGCSTAVLGAAGPGYVTTAPSTLAANSLKLSSTGASMAPQGGTTGTAPTHSCDSACNVDSATPVIVASAASGAGLGTYRAASYGATSLALSAPTTLKAQTGNKVYRIDLVWTLASGPS
jgi:hypothetical protein